MNRNDLPHENNEASQQNNESLQLPHPFSMNNNNTSYDAQASQNLLGSSQFGVTSANTTVRKTLKPIELSRKEAMVFLSGGGLLALLYAVCFSGFDTYPQLSFTLFCPLAFLALTVGMYSLGYMKNPRAILLGVPILILSVYNGIFSLNPFSYGNVLMMHLLMAAYAFSATKPKPGLFNLKGLRALTGIIFGNWLVFVAITKKLIKQRPVSNSRTGIKILLGVMVSLPVLAIIISLLVSADMVLAKLLESLINRIGRLDFITMPFILCLGLFWIYASGYVYQCKQVAESDNPVGFNAPMADVTISATFLTLVNFVFLLFSVIQIGYLFGGGFMTLPKGVVYSQYAREGFFQLLFVTVINFSVIILFMGILRGTKESTLLRSLLLALCCFTGLLIASSFYRMFLYTKAYGHTSLRLCVITFLVMETVLLVISSVRIFYDINFIKWFIITGFVFYLAVNITGSQYLSAKLNMNLFLSGNLEYIDLRPLGRDGLTAINLLLKDDEYVCVEHKLMHKSQVNLEDYVITGKAYLDSFRSDKQCWQNWSYLKDGN